MRFFAVLLLGLLIAGCDISSPLELVYLNRSKFIFTNEKQTSQTIFMCVKGEDKNITDKRAKAANRFYLKETERITDEFTQSIIEGRVDESNTAAIMEKLTKQTEKLILQVEADFECMLIDLIDLDEAKD